MTMRGIAFLCCAGLLVASIGCFGPERVAAPQYNAATVTAAAMTEYDANKDGKLDEKELERCPALKNSIADLDKDADKAISQSELETCLNEFLKSKVAVMTFSCKVTRGGEPLSGAEVKFIPEKFHGDSISAGAGKSDGGGSVEIRTDGKEFPGLAPGFYRVEVSVKGAGGVETLPATNNTQTTLGYQVTQRMRGGIEIKIR